MNPLVLVAGIGAAALLVPRRPDRTHIGALIDAGTQLSSRQIAAKAAGSSSVLTIPEHAKAMSLYDGETPKGASIYSPEARVTVLDAHKRELLSITGPRLLQLGGTVFLPQMVTRKLVIHNGSSATAPAIMASVIYHLSQP